MSKIMSETVFVVSGGAKGITARCVEALAAHFGCRFILMGRSEVSDEPAWAQPAPDEPALKLAAMQYLKDQGEKPTPAAVQSLCRSVLSSREITGTLATIRANGGDADYISVDITNGDAVKTAIAGAESRLGKATGIIHGAGNLADKLIENKTQKDFETVYAAKVQGLENLLNAVPAGQLAYLVLFSSVAGFYGNVGQADYALANEVLNKSAHLYKQANPACHVVTINWGPWDAGMVTPQLKAYFEENNIKVIPVDVGAQMLIEELENPVNDVQVVIGSGLGVMAVAPEGDLKTYKIRRVLRLEDSPFLQDHVVDGKAVLPMVSAMSWMSNAAEQLYPGFLAFGFEDYKVLKGIIFDDTLADGYMVELQEVRKNADEVILDVMISSQPASAKLPRFHYSTQLTLLRKSPPRPVYAAMDLTVREDLPGSQFYDDYTLFHGYAFKGVERVLNINDKLVTMECRLPVVDRKYQGQFPVQSFNYFMTDIGFQSMGIYAKYHYGAGSLPLKAGGGEHYADVPWGEIFYVSLEVHTASETGLVTTLNIHDKDGKMYMKVMDGEITISSRLNDLFKRNRLPQPLG
jgi:NAD(P)-dependent dehydrogenase (short-subunit alcohol dehydrogenase family)